jgi:N-acetylneuraminic acid mutarotase
MTQIMLTNWKPRAPLALPRAGCAVGVVAGRLLVAGGTYWVEGKKFWDRRVDAFDPAANRWQPLAPLPLPWGDAAAVAVGESFYILGGGADGVAQSTVQRYQDGAWSPMQIMALPEPRRSSAAVVLDGTIYLLGGITGTGSDFASATRTLWAARPGEPWQERTPIPGPARFTASVGAVGGRLIVVGGCTPEEGKVRNLDDILVYDPKSNQWSVAGHLPFPLRGACGLAIGERLLVFGGYTDKFLNQIISIDSGSGTSQVVGELPTGLADTRFCLLGTEVLGVTGENWIKQRFPDTIAAALA